ncbi:MAG: hypothetical protein RIQ89_1802 [Bacteroidota bacterium]|jgi:hypothetical protein
MMNKKNKEEKPPRRVKLNLTVEQLLAIAATGPNRKIGAGVPKSLTNQERMKDIYPAMPVKKKPAKKTK